MIEQRSPEWYQARLGRATASNFDKVMMAKTTAGYQEYITTLALERINGQPFESYSSKDMERGVELEATARLRYMLATRNNVEEAEFYAHDSIMAGASPDGLIGTDGLLEIKIPRRHNHAYTLKTGHVPPQYKWQVCGQLWITGRQWTDFVSFSDEFPPNAALAIIRVERDDEMIADLEERVRMFLEEVDKTVEFITNYGANL